MKVREGTFLQKTFEKGWEAGFVKCKNTTPIPLPRSALAAETLAGNRTSGFMNPVE